MMRGKYFLELETKDLDTKEKERKKALAQNRFDQNLGNILLLSKNLARVVFSLIFVLALSRAGAYAADVLQLIVDSCCGTVVRVSAYKLEVLEFESHQGFFPIQLFFVIMLTLKEAYLYSWC